MDIMSFLKNLMSESGVGALIPLINLLRENSFDVKKAINNLTPETLAAISDAFKKSGTQSENHYDEKPVSTDNAISPIANIADKDIVYALNRYVSAEYV